MTKMSSVQNIRLTCSDIRPPPDGAAFPASCAAASPALASRIMIDFENGEQVRMEGLSFGNRLKRFESGWRSGGAPGGAVRAGRSEVRLEIRLELDEQGDDDAEQRDAFDERREDQRVGRDGAGNLRLPRLCLGSTAADLADADASADGGEAGADAGAEHGPGAGVRGVERARGGLQEGKDGHGRSPK